MKTAPLPRPRTQADSHGAGQTNPQVSGSGLSRRITSDGGAIVAPTEVGDRPCAQLERRIIDGGQVARVAAAQGDLRRQPGRTCQQVRAG